MLFIGVDLAWSERNGTGITILKGDDKKAEFHSANIFLSDSEIITNINNEVKGGNALIAVDAPLIVPNEEGRRLAEELVGILFRKYDAGAHPANRKRLASFTGKIRGEEITKLLEEAGFNHEPVIKKFEETRKVFEVYPHPSMVVLFNLNKILQYKAKPRRDYKFRYSEFKKYQSYLKNLEYSKPKLILPEEITEKDVTKLRASSLKRYEDLLDSVFCAYIAYYAWVNPEKCKILGNMKEGYILTPIYDFMKKQLEGIKSQKKLVNF